MILRSTGGGRGTRCSRFGTYDSGFGVDVEGRDLGHACGVDFDFLRSWLYQGLRFR